MSERDPRVEAEVLVRKAEDDASAMRLLADAEISDEIIGFHAQQAVEKWLKAVLGEFPFDNAQVVALTEHAVPLRYDEILDTEPIDRQATLALVNDLGDWAVAQLPPSSE